MTGDTYQAYSSYLRLVAASCPTMAFAMDDIPSFDVSHLDGIDTFFILDKDFFDSMKASVFPVLSLASTEWSNSDMHSHGSLMFHSVVQIKPMSVGWGEVL
ncbi:hypothetical protein Droror1_Dr00009863 [Drosera rotundifolia]